MAKEQGKHTRREEARPIRWTELTRAQQQVARDLCSLLAHQDVHGDHSRFAERRNAGPRSLIQVLPPIEQKRWAHTYLIEGGRGSGKTALLLSLLEHWSGMIKSENAEPWLQPEGDALPNCNVLPVGLFDLRELEQRGALKLHLAVMLRRLYEYVGSRTNDSVPLPGSPMSKPAPLRSAWENFIRAAALDVREPRADADLETFVDELKSAEGDRLDLRARFCEFIDLLLEHYPCGRGQKPPVLLISIDDVDMNPARVMECLTLTQIFAHPRVAYVLTGDRRLFRRVLEQSFWEQLGGTEKTRAEAEQLARKFYNKTLPPAHRQRLYPLSAHERLEVMQGVLERVSVGGMRGDHLFFVLPFLALAFPESMRGVLDLKAECANFARPNVGQESVSILVARIHDIVREDVLSQNDALELIVPFVRTTVMTTGEKSSAPSVDHLQIDVSQKYWQFQQDALLIGRYGKRIEIVVAPGVEIFNKPDLAQNLVAFCILAIIGFREMHPRISVELVRCTLALSGAAAPVVFTWPSPELIELEALLVLAAWTRIYSDGALGRSTKESFDIDRLARRYFEVHCVAKSRNDAVAAPLRDWDSLIEDTSSRAMFPLLLLGAPEYGLDATVRRTILETWKKRAGVWDQHRSMAKRMRAQKLNPQTATRVRTLFGDADPWFEFVEYLAEDLEVLGKLLERPLVCVNPWSNCLMDYLTPELREELRRDPDAADLLSRALQAEPNSDERKILAPLTINHIQWVGTRAQTNLGIDLHPQWSIMSSVGDQALAGYKLSLATANPVVAPWPTSQRVAFVLAHDLMHDRQSDADRSATVRWPLLRTETADGQQGEPWHSPAWRTHLDLWRATKAWNRIVEEWGTSDIGDLFREFVWMQIAVFRRQEYEPSTEKSWPVVIEAIEQALRDASEDQLRHERFRYMLGWIQSWHGWVITREAVMPDAHLAAMAQEWRRIDTARRTQPDWLIAPLLRLLPGEGRTAKGAHVLQVVIEHVRRKHEPRRPELFVAPRERMDAASELVSRLESMVPSIMPALTSDFRQMIQASSTSDILRAVAVFDASIPKGATEALVSCWRACAPRWDSAVLWGGGRLVVQRVYEPMAAFSEPERVDTDIPGLVARCLRGAPKLWENTLLGEIFLGLLSSSAQPIGAFDPIQWPLIEYEGPRASGITPWPCVQWPARQDVYAQIVAWDDSLDSRRSESLNALMREFVAATVDVYEWGRMSGSYSGSWRAVIDRAWSKVNWTSTDGRDIAYQKWVLQLSRFALPRAGLPRNYAAEILVHTWEHMTEIGEPEQSPESMYLGELSGRLNSFRDNGKLDLLIPDDHPAKLLVECAAVADIIEELRRTYEIS